MMRRWLPLVALAVTACGGGGGGGAAPETKQPTVSERKAERDARSLVTEIYQTVSRAKNTDSLMALLAEPLVVFGPRRADAHANRSDALVAMRTILDERGKDANTEVSSGSLGVYASPGGLSAWAVDVVEVEGEPMAMTAVLSNADDFWVVIAAALARTPSMKSVKSQLAKDAIVPPAFPGFGKVPDSAEPAVDRFKRGFADQNVWGDDLGKSSDAVVVGPGYGQLTKGKKDIAKLWKKRAKVNTRYAGAGDISAGTTADGQLTWVTGPVVQFADGEDPLPLRAFAVFERAGSDWKMIALHEAVALDDPGAGANFKKISAPGVKAAEPPPKPKEEKPKAKKKKKRGD